MAAMAFIRTIALEQASGILKQFYEDDLKQDGYIGNTTKAFSLRPEALSAVLGVSREIKKTMDRRRYELVTIVAASRLRCTY
jgi:hypothetical protein